MSKSSLPIHFYKSVENVLGLHRFECGKLIIFLQIFCRVDKKIKYEVTRNLTNKLGQATRSNVTYWRSILVPTWVEFIHFLLRHNDSLAVTFNITQPAPSSVLIISAIFLHQLSKFLCPSSSKSPLVYETSTF